MNRPCCSTITEKPAYADSTVEFDARYRYYVEGFTGELQRSDMAEPRHRSRRKTCSRLLRRPD